MSISSLVAFADLSFLATFMFWIAANESQIGIEVIEMPIAQFAIAPNLDSDLDVQILNIRWREGGKLTLAEKSEYEAIGMGFLTTEEYTFLEVIWKGEILMPAPAKWFPSKRGCYDLRRAIYETAKSWPRNAPVMIRADRSAPFWRISRVADVFNRHLLQSHDVYLAAADGRQ